MQPEICVLSLSAGSMTERAPPIFSLVAGRLPESSAMTAPRVIAQTRFEKMVGHIPPVDPHDWPHGVVHHARGPTWRKNKNIHAEYVFFLMRAKGASYPVPSRATVAAAVPGAVPGRCMSMP